MDAVASLRNEATEEALARDETMLVDQARTLRFDRFIRAAAYWSQLADPDSADQAAERRRARRDVYLAKSFKGMWLGTMTLDPDLGVHRVGGARAPGGRAVRSRLGRGP